MKKKRPVRKYILAVADKVQPKKINKIKTVIGVSASDAALKEYNGKEGRWAFMPKMVKITCLADFSYIFNTDGKRVYVFAAKEVADIIDIGYTFSG